MTLPSRAPVRFILSLSEMGLAESSRSGSVTTLSAVAG